MAYFFLYAVVGAARCGVGIPLYWTTVVRRRSIADLGITTHWLGRSLALHEFSRRSCTSIRWRRFSFRPSSLVCLSPGRSRWASEAIFWRGWVLLRLEEAFGIIPAILLGSVLYAAYHIGYGMPASEMITLFFVGVMFAVVFRLTKNVFILWPIFQPMGQLVTLINDGLTLPLAAALGFVEVLILMFVFVWLAARRQRKHRQPECAAYQAQAAN